MITYDRLAATPKAFPVLTGLARAEFDQVSREFAAVRAIIDAREQAFRRPGGWDEQKPFRSDKRTRHTVKNQVVCNPLRADRVGVEDGPGPDPRPDGAAAHRGTRSVAGRCRGDDRQGVRRGGADAGGRW